jgi:hypothetical protein
LCHIDRNPRKTNIEWSQSDSAITGLRSQGLMNLPTRWNEQSCSVSKQNITSASTLARVDQNATPFKSSRRLIQRLEMNFRLIRGGIYRVQRVNHGRKNQSNRSIQRNTGNGGRISREGSCAERRVDPPGPTWLETANRAARSRPRFVFRPTLLSLLAYSVNFCYTSPQSELGHETKLDRIRGIATWTQPLRE